MNDAGEHEERQRLDYVQLRLGEALAQLQARVRRYAKDVQEQKT